MLSPSAEIVMTANGTVAFARRRFPKRRSRFMPPTNRWAETVTLQSLRWGRQQSPSSAARRIDVVGFAYPSISHRMRPTASVK